MANTGGLEQELGRCVSPVLTGPDKGPGARSPRNEAPLTVRLSQLVPIPPRLTVSSLGALLSVFFYRTNFLSTR